MPTALNFLARLSRKSWRNPGHAERLAGHTERVEVEDPGKNPVLCWACNAELPAGTIPRCHGWHTRELDSYAYGQSKVIKELYCPDCFDEFGWGD